MSAALNVVLRKEDIDPERAAGKVAVVLDVIFATTSIATALAHGVEAVLPAADFDAARRLAEGIAPDRHVLGGELNAQTFPGAWSFAPTAMQDPFLAGKLLVLATTNGTGALCRCDGFDHVYAAALVNGAAVMAHVLAHHPGQDVVLVCAGSRGRFSFEDFYGAGWLADWALAHSPPDTWRCGDTALAAIAASRAQPPEPALAQARLGRHMIDRGLASDVRHAARTGLYGVVPVYRRGRIDIA